MLYLKINLTDPYYINDINLGYITLIACEYLCLFLTYFK